MDDIVMFSKSFQEHLQNLKLIFEELKQYGTKIQLDKSSIFRPYNKSRRNQTESR